MTDTSKERVTGAMNPGKLSDRIRELQGEWKVLAGNGQAKKAYLVGLEIIDLRNELAEVVE